MEASVKQPSKMGILQRVKKYLMSAPALAMLRQK